MIGLTLFLTALVAFSVGLICGMNAIPSPKGNIKAAKTEKNGNIEKMRREFSNFLSYDGTEQEEIRDGKDE